jgi:hypothetical protein
VPSRAAYVEPSRRRRQRTGKHAQGSYFGFLCIRPSRRTGERRGEADRFPRTRRRTRGALEIRRKRGDGRSWGPPALPRRLPGTKPTQEREERVLHETGDHPPVGRIIVSVWTFGRSAGGSFHPPRPSCSAIPFPAKAS